MESLKIAASEKVRFLSDKNSYPDKTSHVSSLETHMSWVFLTDKHVYKMKKPVKYPFLDFSTTELREFDCKEEIRLNRRLAGDVYIGLVALSLDESGSLNLMGKGQTIEWLVKMKRLPENKMLINKIKERTLTPEEIYPVARNLNDLYKNQHINYYDTVEYYNKIKQELVSDLNELKHPVFEISHLKLDVLRETFSEFLNDNADLIRSRSDKVTEAHGDLRPEHIYVNKEPLIIDCLEFSKALRLLDPVEELSYLALECDILNANWIGETLLKVYRSISSDSFEDKLVSFYKSKRAVLRALICYRHILEPRYSGTKKWIHRGDAYLDKAFEYMGTV